MRDVLGVGPGLEYEPAWGVETRVITISRSDGVVNVVTPVLLVVVKLLLLFFELL